MTLLTSEQVWDAVMAMKRTRQLGAIATLPLHEMPRMRPDIIPGRIASQLAHSLAAWIIPELELDRAVKVEEREILGRGVMEYTGRTYVMSSEDYQKMTRLMETLMMEHEYDFGLDIRG